MTCMVNRWLCSEEHCLSSSDESSFDECSIGSYASAVAPPYSPFTTSEDENSEEEQGL